MILNRGFLTSLWDVYMSSSSSHHLSSVWSYICSLYLCVPKRFRLTKKVSRERVQATQQTNKGNSLSSNSRDRFDYDLLFLYDHLSLTRPKWKEGKKLCEKSPLPRVPTPTNQSLVLTMLESATRFLLLHSNLS